MKSVTAGEKLYFLIRDEVIHTIGDRNARWSQAKSFFDALDDDSSFTSYVKGAVAVRATRQLTRFWSWKRESIVNQSQYIRILMAFLKEEMFLTTEPEVLRKVATATEEAFLASGRDPSSNLRKTVLGRGPTCKCYLCGKELNSASADAADHPTVEHIWPSSMGGDTIEENLLPACKGCQNLTKDTLSWEWVNIQNWVLPVCPSVDALTAVDRRTRYARHFFEAMTRAETERKTLKEALISLGPMQSPPTHIGSGKPVTFFDLQTFRSQ